MNELELDKREKDYKIRRQHEIRIGIFFLISGVVYFIFLLIILQPWKPSFACNILGGLAMLFLCLGLMFLFNPINNIPEEIKLWRQLLKTNEFEEVIIIWQKIWDDMSQKIRHETLEKGLQLAKTPQEIAFIYKISPTSSEVETKALETLLIKIKEKKNEIRN
jgi:hypothetical protein